MHHIEPYFNWRHLYSSEEDPDSPFFGKVYSEFSFSEKVYDHFLHPQWDNIGSPTLFIKIIYCNYEQSFVIIELIGEWNDCINNDIMFFKRDIIDHLTQLGVTKFMLIGENVMNFHYSDDCYYEEWFDDIDEGWIVAVNFHEHVLREFSSIGIDHYINSGGELDNLNWRTYKPENLMLKIETIVNMRLN